MDAIGLSDAEREVIARRKVTCPFLGPVVRAGLLPVRGSAERPLAAVADVETLGDAGGGDLGRRVLRRFAIGNHRRVPGPAGGFDEAVPAGMMSLDLAGSQGAHAGHSGIMLGDPRRIDAGRFSEADFARLAAHADADGRLSEAAVGRFIAENIARDPDARVLPLGRIAVDLAGVADEVFDSLLARLGRRRTEQDEAELLEKLTKLAGADNLIGSAGEFGLLFAFFANRGEGEGIPLAEVRAMMADQRLPEGWDVWPKQATDWVRATLSITASALKARAGIGGADCSRGAALTVAEISLEARPAAAEAAAMTETRPFPAWPDVAAELIAVAARRAPADLVIRNCAWVNVHSREVIAGSDIAIKAGRFAVLRAGRRGR